MAHNGYRSRIAGFIRDAVFAARDRGDTIYAASDDAAKKILADLPKLKEGSDETALVERLENLLLKWRNDRAEYPVEGDYRAHTASITVELCERELRTAIDG